MFFNDVVREGGNLTGDDNGAAVHGVVAVGDLATKIDILFDEQNREGVFLFEVLHGQRDRLHILRGALKDVGGLGRRR